MKTLTNIALALVLLATATAARADWVRGYYRSSGTYVAPHYRTPANSTPYDNLSYRGYPSQQPGYVSPRSYSGTSSSYGNTTYHNYRSSYGGSLSGTTTRYGYTPFATRSGW